MESALAVVAFIITAVGVLFGENRDKSVPGIKGVKPLGYLMLFAAVVVLVFSVFKATQTDAHTATLDGQVHKLTTALATANQRLVDNGTTMEGIGTLQRQFGYVQGAMKGVVDSQKTLGDTVRSNQQTVSARALRTALDNSFCFLNPLFRIHADGASAQSLEDFDDQKFLGLLRSRDLNMKLDDIQLATYNGQPAYVAINHLAAEDLERFGSQLRAASVYLPLEITQSAIQFQKDLTDVSGIHSRDIAVYANQRLLEHGQSKMEIQMLADAIDEELFERTYKEAKDLDDALADLASDDNSSPFAYFNCHN